MEQTKDLVGLNPLSSSPISGEQFIIIQIQFTNFFVCRIHEPQKSSQPPVCCPARSVLALLLATLLVVVMLLVRPPSCRPVSFHRISDAERCRPLPCTTNGRSPASLTPINSSQDIAALVPWNRDGGRKGREFGFRPGDSKPTDDQPESPGAHHCYQNPEQSW